jgi:DNA-binding MarR family transcriptional regulator
MSDETLSQHAAHFTEIVRHLIHLRSRLKTTPTHMRHAHPMAHLLGLNEPSSEINPTEFDLLYKICVICSHHETPISMGELRAHLDVPLSTATRTVDWLVKQGIVERIADPDDRRIVRVGLTDRGHAIHRAGSAMIQMRSESLLRHFDPEERETLLRLMEKLVQALEEEA